MSPVRLGVAAAVVAAAALTGTHALERNADVLTTQDTQEVRRPGPDSARVALLLTSLDRGDALVCALIADQIGNQWWNDEGDAPGRFADARAEMIAAKDSLNGRIEHAGTIQLLTATLGHANPCVRRVAAKLLGRSRVETSSLVGLLDDASPMVREAAAYAIGSGTKRGVRAALEKVLAQRGAPEAAMAAWALQEEDDSAAVPALERALRHADARVRFTAAYALGEIGEESAAPALERVLTADSDARARRYAAHAIGELGTHRSVDALSAAISDRDASVRYAAVEAMGEIHDLEQAPSALRQACTSSDRKLARLATLAVAEMHDPTTLDLLISLSAMDDRDVRLHIAEALGEIGSPKASDALMRLLKDADAHVRRAAAEALGEIRENSERN